MENLNKQIQELQKIIDTYGSIVFFGGAGVSTESGIPDFRSVDGLYHQQYDYPPETILSHTFYRSTRRNSSVFTGIRCSSPMHSRTPPIKNWQNWKLPEKSGP